MALILGLGSILLGFSLGVVAVVAAEALGLLWIMKRLRHKLNKDEANLLSKTKLGSHQLDHQQSLHFASKKQVVFEFLTFAEIIVKLESHFCFYEPYDPFSGFYSVIIISLKRKMG